MHPNIPHHFDRRPTDYPRPKPPKYGWRDDNGRPIHEIDEEGNPICGRLKADTKEPCQQTILSPNGRCRAPGHGGTSPGGPLKHGRYSRFIPTRLAASYESITNDDVINNVRENIALIVAMIQDKLAEMGEKSGAELWQAANKAFSAVRDAIYAHDQTSLLIALDQLSSILTNGTGVQQKEREILDLMVKASKLHKVEIHRLEKMKQFMTPEQMLANTGRVIAVLKKHVEPSVAARVAAELGIAVHSQNQ